MTVKELAELLHCEVLVGEEGLGNEVTGGYCGDMLSWVMAHAKEGNAWITVIGNVNSVAVAALRDLACILLAEDATLDEESVNRAKYTGVPVLKSPSSTYALAAALSRALEQ